MGLGAHGTTDSADEVTLSRKGAKSQTPVTGLRPTGTKAGTPVALSGGPQAALIKKLKARAHDLERKLSEALEQQTATSEVLSIISRSPGYLQLVFDAMLENAVRLCAAKFGILWLAESDGFRSVALYGLPPALDELRRREPFVKFGPLTGIGRVLQTKQVFHVDDMKDSAFLAHDPRAKYLVELGGARTVVFAPLLRDKDAIGVLVIYRQEVNPFTDKQIELVTNFAMQAVIAIENTRLLNELRESLQQQTATADVLKVISRSTFDLKAVLNTLVESAARLCDADAVGIAQQKGTAFCSVANYGLTAEQLRAMKDIQIVAGRGSAAGRAILEGQPVHVPDVLADPEFTFRGILEVRTVLGVPLLREGLPIGVMVLQRKAMRPFTDKQIELATTFADQAVIAIENVRLFDEVQARTRELSEALEQQTATSEVLRVISCSPGELEPVFETMLANAIQLCGAKFGVMSLREGEAFRVIATHGAPAALVEQRRREPLVRPTPGHNLERMMRTKAVVRIPDILADPKSAPTLAKFGGAKALVNVPLLKDGDVIGSIVIFRQEAGPFTDKQIELVQNFADQAVIAIENTRLLNELRESLQQQAATTDVLKVISSSPGELEPVFQAMLENATRICEAKYGVLFRYEDGFFYPAATLNPPPALADFLQRRGRFLPAKGTALDTAIKTKKVVHIDDDAAQEVPTAPARFGGARSYIAVPMLKEDQVIGAIVIYRQEVRPFTDKQVELVTNFAAQAVIAIENTRLLNELRQRTDDLSEALEQQTATSEVLQVISSSPGDLEPVFQAVLGNAVRICEASFGALLRFEGGAWRSAAMLGVPPAFAEFWQRGLQRPGPRTALGRVIETRRTVHIADVTTEPAYVEGEPIFVAAVNLGRFRTVLTVPMLKDNELIGVFAIYRQEVRPFTDTQIDLVANFAAQAVIAIENTRLLNELRRIPPTADRHCRRAQGHQPLDVRSKEGARHIGSVSSAAVRREQGLPSTYRRYDN